MSFSESLKQENVETWNKILNHEIIREMAEDILPKSKFIFYLKQDQIFLKSFCKLLAVASRIAYDKETKAWFEYLSDSTTRYEMPMQFELINLLDSDSKSIGVSPKKTTLDYIYYLERVSDSCDLAVMLSAMAPCPWTYYEISSALDRQNIKSEILKQWIRFYSSKESLKQVTAIRGLLDKLALNSGKEKKRDMKNYFSTSCKHELEFWDMAHSCNINEGEVI